MFGYKKLSIIIFSVLFSHVIFFLEITIAFDIDNANRIDPDLEAVGNIREDIKTIQTNGTNIRKRLVILQKWIKTLVEYGFYPKHIVARDNMIEIEKMIINGEIKEAAKVIDSIYFSLEKLLTEKEKEIFKRTPPPPNRIRAKTKEYLELWVKDSMIGIHGSLVSSVGIRQTLSGYKKLATSRTKILGSLGIHWLRGGPHWGVTWIEVEPEKGKFDFTRIDFILAITAENGINVIGDHISSFVPWDNPFHFPRDKQTKYKSSTHFIRYVKTLVERYDGDLDFGLKESDLAYPKCDFNGNGVYESQEKREWADTHKILYWEVLNEPTIFFKGFHEDYLDILKTTYKAIKEVAPHCLVLNAAPADTPSQREMTFFHEWIKRGGYKYFDILNLHIYSYDTTKLIDRYKSILTSYCPSCADRDIWITEAGAPSWHRIGKASPESQASEIVERYVLAFANGASKVFWHRIYDGPITGRRENDDWAKHGIFDYPERKPKPSYFALKLLLEKIDGFLCVETIQTKKQKDGEIFLFKFEKKSKSTYVVWSTNPLKYQFKTENDVIITHINGDKKIQKPIDNIVALNISTIPIFIEYSQ